MKLILSILFTLVTYFITLGVFILGISIIFNVDYSSVATFPITVALSIIMGLFYVITVSEEVYIYLDKNMS